MDLVIPNDFVSGDHARIVPGKLMRDLHRGSQAYHAELHSHVSHERVMMPQSQTLMLFPNSMWKRLSFDHCFFGKLESALRSSCSHLSGVFLSVFVLRCHTSACSLPAVENSQLIVLACSCLQYELFMLHR